MKKTTKAIILSAAITLLMSSSVLAAGWSSGQGENSSRWWYDLEDGNYYAGTLEVPSWQWIDGNQDGVSECYAFDESGWMYADTQTPDGYQVNEDGAWVENGIVQTIGAVSGSADEGQEDENTDTASEDDSQVLVAYFSATNTTEGIAEIIAEAVNADLYEIIPEEPYTSSDLNYNNDNSRTTLEMNDPSSRPEISGSVENMEQYDIVFLGYPIWWGDAPRIMSTFVESYDFSGKTIVPFCTSGSSGIGSSASDLEELTEGAEWLSGRRFSGNSTRAELREWLNGLGLNLAVE